MPANDVEDETGAGETASRHKPKSRLLWLILAAFCVAGTLALGLLNVLGAGTGPVVNIVAALLLVAAFLGAVSKGLEQDLRQAGRRARWAYMLGVVFCAVVLLVAGLVTRTVAPLHRMPGTADIAVVGFRAPSSDTQQTYDDVAVSLAKALPSTPDGEVRNYSTEVEPPLEDLSADPADLNSWLEQFLVDTDAELVVAGYAETSEGGQTAVHTVVYIPESMASDAAELSGWYDLDDSLADRQLNSATARRALLDQVVEQLRGVTAFLEGLDAWQAGFAADAVKAFSRVVPDDPSGTPSTLEDLARLFRGHALESRSQAANPSDRGRLLRSARRDYVAIPDTSPIAARARVSQATNAYLRAAHAGCAAGSQVVLRLVHSADVLGGIAEDTVIPALLRRKAQVNQAQIELCRLRAGDSSSAARLDTLLSELTDMSLPEDEAHGDAYRQIKALALSIRAIRFADARRLDEAVNAMAEALELDPRFERQALWSGLRSAWLLADCHINEGAAAQERSLSQVRAAVNAGRLPATEINKYSVAFTTDLDAARTRCDEER